ncbi:MAG: hypothetical protein AAF726_03345 [Planctomycetota bacterium]
MSQESQNRTGRDVLRPAAPPTSDVQNAVDGASRAELDEALTETIRRWGGTTTPEDLEKRGVRKLRTVRMSHVASLIEKAVNRALIARTLDERTDESLAMSESARTEFLRLAKAELDAHREQKETERRATSTLDRLRKELADSKKELADRESRLDVSVDDSAADDHVTERLRELFAIHAEGKDAQRVLESRTIDVALEEVRAARSRAREMQLAISRREVDRLERRIEKLTVLLDETEQQLRAVRARKTIDPGIASIYEAVQGLDEGDGMFEQKTELMRCIFEANLALRE